jgi:small subunit ribosomal protein S21
MRLTAGRGDRLSCRFARWPPTPACTSNPSGQSGKATIERQVNQSVAEVKLGDNESLESALRRFKRKVQQEDIIREVKRHAFYIPPGEKARLKSALARKRNRKKFRRPVIITE